MGRNKEHDWLMAEMDFIFSLEKCTLKDISDRYCIPHQSVRRHAIQHNWNQKRVHARCVIREGVRFKLLEELFGHSIHEFTDDSRVTWLDLAYLQCHHLDPDRNRESEG